MPSGPCSKIVSRKSRRRFAGLLLVLSSLWLPVSISAQISHTVTTNPHPDYLEVSLNVNGAEPDRLFSNLSDGLTARVEYTIRVLEPRSAPMSIFGPRLLREFRVIYNVRRDPFRRRYTLTTHDGGLYTFRDEAALWSFLFVLPGYRIPWEAIEAESASHSGRFVIETRTTYDPIVFAPGLSILWVFLSQARHESGWTQREIEVMR